MKIFDEAPVACPPVRVTPLDDDETGRELLNRLNQLQQQLADANHRAAASSRPLPNLIARADELAAQSMAGQADPDAADAAEEAVREAQAEVESARREARQCTQAITLVEEKLDARARKLYKENAENVREAHRTLAEATLEAQERASALLRILREFEMRYARYTESAEPEPYPRYLRDEERTRPPRSIMGPAQSPNGHVYASGDATSWMQRAAQLLQKNGPAVIEVETLDFEAESTHVSLDNYSPLDATHNSERPRPSKPHPEKVQRPAAHPETVQEKQHPEAAPEETGPEAHHGEANPEDVGAGGENEHADAPGAETVTESDTPSEDEHSEEMHSEDVHSEDAHSEEAHSDEVRDDDHAGHL